MKISAGAREIAWMPSGDGKCPLIILLGEAKECEAVARVLEQTEHRPFSLAAVHMQAWNRELSPWPSPALSRRDEPFSGGADEFLAELVELVLPEIYRQMPEPPVWTALAGYSLAGLTAIYAAYRTDVFSRLISASGSFWYPDFLSYVRTHTMRGAPKSIYLSVGDRESRTRHPVLRQVEECTRTLAAHFEAQGIRTVFELNPGNHFQEPEKRLARGIAWTLADGQLQ